MLRSYIFTPQITIDSICAYTNVRFELTKLFEAGGQKINNRQSHHASAPTASAQGASELHSHNSPARSAPFRVKHIQGPTRMMSHFIPCDPGHSSIDQPFIH